MPEILTESFCERCGTRYTFESGAPTKVRKLGRFKTISKGLKNYVMSDDTSLDEAMAAARSDDELEHTAQQLDAFHSTFNFCMNCRQYTCANCWNEGESRCLTCAPHLGHEILPAPFPDLPAPVAEAPPEAWPVADIGPVAAAAALTGADEREEIDAAGRLDRLSAPTDDSVPSWLAEAEAEALASAEARAAEEAADEAYIAAELPFEEPVVAEVASIAPEEPKHAPVELAAAAAVAAAVDEPEAEAEPLVADAEPAAPVAESEPVPLESPVEVAAVEVIAPTIAADAAVLAEEESPAESDDQAAVAARQTSDLLAKFRPGQSIDAELDAYEAALAAKAASEAVDEAPVDVAATAEPDHDAIETARDVAAIAAVAAAVDEPDTADAEPVAVGPEPVAAEAEPVPVEPVAVEPEPVAAVADAEPVAVEPEPVAAVADEAAAVDVAPEPLAPEPEPIAAAAEAEPIAAAADADAARTDVVEQPTWRIVAPDAPLTNGHPPTEPTIAPPASPAVTSAPPEWPTAPEWPQANVAHLDQRRSSQSAAMDALWAASVRDVVAPTQDGPVGTVQPCNSCGLSLSANARFCRRCGTRQGA